MRRLPRTTILLPYSLDRAHLTAWLLGIRDGWRQPRELSTSTNVEHLATSDAAVWTLQESLDAGINLGQRLRSPRHHQTEW